MAPHQDKGGGSDQNQDKGSDQDKGQDKDEGGGNDTDKGSDKDKEKDPVLPEPSTLALVPQVHADSCHYCAGGLFRAANLLLSDVINHRQRCKHT